MAENYSVVSFDALDVIESQPGTITQRLRLASVFVLLSLNVDQQCTRWGGKACAARLGMDRSSASRAIATLETMTFDDGEPLLERMGEYGYLTNRKPTRRNPIRIPYILKDRCARKDGKPGGEPGTSYIELMFADDARFVVQARRLMLLMRIYAAFDDGAMCCPSLMFEPLAPEDYYADDLVQMARAPTLIFATIAMAGWMYPAKRKEREEASRDATDWLATAGLLSIVRVVHSKGEVFYVASFSSGYWNTRTGNFQGRIREIAGNEAFLGMEPLEGGMPTYYYGGDLAMSIMPQRIVITDRIAGTIKAHQQLHDEIIEELGEVE